MLVQRTIRCGSQGGTLPRRPRAQLHVRFPGEDAPGTGRRVFPSKQETQKEKSVYRDIDRHHLVATVDYYAAFPSLVHTSCPLNITDTGNDTRDDQLEMCRTVPSGMSIRDEPDAGPATGKRRVPEVFDTEPVPLDPDHEETVEERLRELKIKRGC